MTRITHPLELLAPAKNLEFGIEAIRHGADAVYIGGPTFGARAAAGNSVADIEQLCGFAHHFGAHVYVAFNTLLQDEELAAAERLTHQLYEAGADALIVQDMGLLQLDLPPIALHASTQTDNRTLDKVRFLEQVGFSQVVLARELSLPEIRSIADQTQVALEFFIHGALCVSYSGQCYISHALTGRSANRGECAQICRLPCSLENQRDGQLIAPSSHLLSLKDMDQSVNLRALIDAGVRSLKIEGRLKGVDYVKNITAWYRRQLDTILAERPELARASVGRSSYTFTPDPKKSFNRGSTDYFLHGRQPEITSFLTPKYAGEPVGVLQESGSQGKTGTHWLELAQVPPEVEFHNGDGLTFFAPNRTLTGLRVNRAEGHRLYLAEPVAGLVLGMPLYRNHDQAFATLLAKPSAERRIAVTLTLQECEGGLSLRLRDESGVVACVSTALDKQPAKDPERALSGIREQLAKLGTTDFYASHIELQLAQPWFIPVGLLNQLRRDGIAALAQARHESYQRPAKAAVALPVPLLGVSSLSYLGNVYNAAAEAFFRQHGVEQIAPAYECDQQDEEVSLMITKHCLRYSFDQCPKERGPGFKPDPLQLTIGPDTFRLRFDCKRCEMHVLGRLKSKKR
ncbi:MAG: U32 family peptidase [Aeromonadaceae bacterium]